MQPEMIHTDAPDAPLKSVGIGSCKRTGAGSHQTQHIKNSFAGSASVSGLFVFSALAIFLLSGVFKVLSVLGKSDYLVEPAPLFPELSWRELLVVATVVELACVTYILKHGRKIHSAFAILWLSTLLMLFRTALHAIGYKSPCHCLGYLGDWLGLSPAVLDTFLWGFLVFFFFGSLAYVLRWRIAGARQVATVLLTALALLWRTPASQALDFKAIGEQQAIAMVGSRTALVQTASFTIARVGRDWSIVNEYTNTGTKQYAAVVEGIPYTVTWNAVDGSTAGLALEDLRFLLEGLPEFGRVLFAAFLAPKAEQALLTNAPVPFLFPRHPALLAYDWKVDWSPSPPSLPGSIRFEINDRLFKRIPREDVVYFYGEPKGKERLKRFRATQGRGAEYSVLEWTDFAGAAFPARASLRSDQFDEKQDYQRIHFFKVASLEVPNGYRLLPPLAPNSYVQHVVDHKTYLYLAADGRWLKPEEVQKIGRVMPKAPARPSALATSMPVAARFLIFLLITMPIGFWLASKLRRRSAAQKQNT